MGDIGLEQLRDSTGKPQSAPAGGTKSGTTLGSTVPASVIVDHDLASLIAAWQSLTSEQRQTILAAAGIGTLTVN